MRFYEIFEQLNNLEEDYIDYGVSGGYDGKSMSNRARAAYANGEMPLSKWGKHDIINALEEYCDEEDIDIDLSILSKLTADELRKLFLKNSSWHHTGSFYNSTNFYSLRGDLNSVLNDLDREVEFVIKCRQKKKKSAEEKGKESKKKDVIEQAKDISAKLEYIFQYGNSGYKYVTGLIKLWKNGGSDKIEKLFKDAYERDRNADAHYNSIRSRLTANSKTVKDVAIYLGISTIH